MIDYNRVHTKYQRLFRRIIENFGYYDLALIDFKKGSIVYDVNKDRDFGTSLVYGPYRDSNLAKLYQLCRATDNPDDVFLLSDFEPSEASRGEPSHYGASPIWDGTERAGVFALQPSTAEIDDVMTGRRGWIKNGLGIRLKCGEQEIADKFADVSVLFGDLVGFTTLSSTKPADELVEMLNGLFSRFDLIANELGIEKIKTIGDCYMAVCGLPPSRPITPQELLAWRCA